MDCDEAPAEQPRGEADEQSITRRKQEDRVYGVVYL